MIMLVAVLPACGRLGSTGPNACGDRGPSVPKMSAAVEPFDGPAIVERSASKELVLAYAPAPLPSHLSIVGLTRTPKLPLGTKVWLSMGIHSGPATAPFPGGVPKYWLAVHDREGGHLLLGAGYSPPPSLLAPLTFADGRVTCSGSYSDYCGSGTATYSSVAVHGDATVFVDDGQTRTVRADGLEYEVAVMSRTIELTNRSPGCAGPGDGFAVDVQAKDLSSLGATLDVGPPIACARGNAEVESVAFSLSEIASGTPYDGPVVYKDRRVSGASECFTFTTELEVGAGRFAPIEFCAPPGRFRQPTVGQEFWATTTSFRLGALKSPNGGTLLLGTAFLDTSLKEPTGAQLESVLGIRVQPRVKCTYATKPDGSKSSLWEVVLGETAPVVVETSGHALVSIGTGTYDVWMAEGSLSFVAR
jgi:hypothetical protein